MKSNQDLSAYHSDMPYPEIKVLGKNSYYASLLKKNYAGYVSELTAVNQYFYHHIVVEDIDEEIANMLKNIAQVEMGHLDILSQLIFLLGDKPIFFAENNFWNGDYVYYGENILGQLEADLQAEYDAIANYRKNIEVIEDINIVNILKRIILDEEVHVRLFKKAIEKVKESQIPKETLTDVIEEVFPNNRYYK